MAAYMSPAHRATTNQFERIEEAGRLQAPVLEILNAGSARMTKDIKRAFLNLSKQIHPDRGGNFDVLRATRATQIVARAFEQAKRAAEFDSYSRAGCTWTSTFDPLFLIPESLLYSRLLKAQQDAEEAEEAACAERCNTEDSNAASGDCSDDDDGVDGGAGLAALFIPLPPTPIPDVAEERFPDFVGVDYSPEHKAYIVESKKFYRKQQLHRARVKAKVLAKNRIEAARFGSLSWLPLPFEHLSPPQCGDMFEERWKTEQYVRSWTAMMGVQGGVQLKIDFDSVRASCTTCSLFCMVFNYQPKHGEWILRHFVGHDTGCFGAPTPADGATANEAACPCKSAYTAAQVARVVVSRILIDVDSLTIPQIRDAVKTSYLRPPSTRFLSNVKTAIATSMQTDRAVDMAALQGYAAALATCGHKVTPPCSWICCLLSRSPHAGLSF